MRPDVIELQAFYGSRQGQLVRRLVSRQLRLLWPDLADLRVLGLGYALPFLGPLSDGAERVCVVMSPAQGVVRWPPERPNQVASAAVEELPLPDRSIDRVLMVHALESAEQSQRLLREVWRVLADGGQALVVVPNRRGLWCLSESTPFGHGRPFSSTQLKEALRGNLFTPRRTARALFVPPSRSRLVLRTAVAWERLGLRWAKHFAGVLLMEAEKQIYAVPAEPALSRRRAPAYVPIPRALAAAERISEPPRQSVCRRSPALTD
jgi:SAM-dependent methyltransferase